MYKHRDPVHRTVRDSWHVLQPEEVPDRPAIARTAQSRQSSAPITIFSADEGQNAGATTEGILPGHVGGVFSGTVGEGTSAYSKPLEKEKGPRLESDSEALTSLGSALDEVLQSVDATTEMHQRARSNSRIQDWLGQQSEIHTQKKRKCSKEEQQRIKRLTEGILRDLLGVDQSVLNILFRSQDPKDAESAKNAREIEVKIWKRWIELARRDTASLQGNVRTVPTATTTPTRQNIRGKTLEKIPWGVPEDAQDEAYWNEKISLPMIFKYLKSCLSLKNAQQAESESDAATTPMERSQKYTKMTQSVSTQTQTTGTVIGQESTVHATSTIMRPSFTRLSRSARHGVADRSRSRTSRSSSFRTLSQTGTCSVASLRRSALGSNFWDMGSLGGVSVNSREVGNWSVYA